MSVTVQSPAAPSRRGVRAAVVAAFAYGCLAVVMTWPVAAHLPSRVPSDLGDPLLNAWILAWDAQHVGRALSGHPSALGDYWNANIFHPQRLTLAFSEHLTPQALQVAPVYWITGNPILCYNLAFLSTFVLSGLGAFLLARDLTGSRGAAFVAGVAFAFAPYRFSAMAHLQILSAQWMPFALLGFRRYFETRRRAPLAWGAFAWLVQNLSCGYYLLFFSPVVVLYAAWEVARRRLWGNVSVLAHLAVAAVAVIAATMPFLLPYMAVRRDGFNPRSLEETISLSANVWAYATARSDLWLWGRTMRAFPRAEGYLFPGLAIALLAAVAIAAGWRDVRPPQGPDAHAWLRRALGWAAFAAGAVVVALLLGWSIRTSIAGVPLKVTRLAWSLTLALALAGAWLRLAPGTRARLGAWLRTEPAAWCLIVLFALVMSWGPEIHAGGRTVSDASLYLAFYNWVPGFDGVRVPARFAMVVSFGLAMLAALAARRLENRAGRVAVSLACAAVVIESLCLPVTTNFNDTNYRMRDLAPQSDLVETGANVPAVYDYVRRALPADAVLVELPFGEAAFEIRYTFYSTWHWRRLVNGYSGGVTPAHAELTRALERLDEDPAAAWRLVTGAGTTHVLLHDAAYRHERATPIADWLVRHGAREIARFPGDRVFELVPTANR